MNTLIALIIILIAAALVPLIFMFRQIGRVSAGHPGSAEAANFELLVWLQRTFLLLFAMVMSTLALSAYVVLQPAGAPFNSATLESKVEATQSKVEATQSKVDAAQSNIREARSKIDETQAKLEQTQSTVSRIETLVSSLSMSVGKTFNFQLERSGKLVVAGAAIGFALIFVGFVVDYLRARPKAAPTSEKKAGPWAEFLKQATVFKLAGSFCLFGSLTIATFNIDSIFKFETHVTEGKPTEPTEPAEMHVSLQYFVNQLVSTTTPPPPPPGRLQTPEVDCGPKSDPDLFILKTFVTGKDNDFEGGLDAFTSRLNTVIDIIGRTANGRNLMGIIFIGSADKRPLGRATREQHSTNSTLAKKRAEFVKERYEAQIKLRSDSLRPHWFLMLNPDIPKVRLTIEGHHAFDALRAVQICAAWSREPVREATAEPPQQKR